MATGRLWPDWDLDSTSVLASELRHYLKLAYWLPKHGRDSCETLALQNVIFRELVCFSEVQEQATGNRKTIGPGQKNAH